jgi:hypothetical protein
VVLERGGLDFVKNWRRGVGKKGSYVGSHHEQENANQPAGERTGGLARGLHGSSGRSLVSFLA